MPADLLEAHKLNDEAVERCYRARPFESDEDRLQVLFDLYAKMIAEEADKGSLLSRPKPRRNGSVMPDFVNVNYAQNWGSISVNPLGMREMQERAYEARFGECCFSGTTGVRKVAGAHVPRTRQGGEASENSEGHRGGAGTEHRKFVCSRRLKKHGFFADWDPQDEYNLCTPGADGSASKVQKFHAFMEGDAQILICTATLRFGAEGLSEKVFDGCLLAIDEFHHVSADADNRLERAHSFQWPSQAHIIAMTGSYFRGDSVPVLLPNDERKFTKVTTNYYEQLNGYSHLKSLGIGYTSIKGSTPTPSWRCWIQTARPSYTFKCEFEKHKQKYEEVNHILGPVGEVVKQTQKQACFM